MEYIQIYPNYIPKYIRPQYHFSDRRSNMSVYFFTQFQTKGGLIPWQYSGWRKTRITRSCQTTTYATPTCP